MKLKNIFKKKSDHSLNAKITSLDKKQLEKVIGGGDPTLDSTDAVKTRAKVIMDRDSG